MYRLGADGGCEVEAKPPLARLLQTNAMHQQLSR